MRIDETGEWWNPIAAAKAAVVGAIATCVTTIVGGAVGGISAVASGKDGWGVLEGIGKGAVVGAQIGVAGTAVAVGTALGPFTPIGSALVSYGLSTIMNFVEVAFLQGYQSHKDGDDGWEGTFDVIDAIFENSWDIQMGNITMGGGKLPLNVVTTVYSGLDILTMGLVTLLEMTFKEGVVGFLSKNSVVGSVFAYLSVAVNAWYMIEAIRGNNLRGWKLKKKED